MIRDVFLIESETQDKYRRVVNSHVIEFLTK